MARFLDLLENSVILQGIITCLIIAAVVYLAVAGDPIPDILEKLALLIVGYFFGSKQTQAVSSAYKQARKGG
jgi:hypothetical protein